MSTETTDRPYHSLLIERDGLTVRVEITATDEYAAIELYDGLLVTAREGNPLARGQPP
jgi:hypothetical protein